MRLRLKHPCRANRSQPSAQAPIKLSPRPSMHLQNELDRELGKRTAVVASGWRSEQSIGSGMSVNVPDHRSGWNRRNGSVISISSTVKSWYPTVAKDVGEEFVIRGYPGPETNFREPRHQRTGVQQAYHSYPDRLLPRSDGLWSIFRGTASKRNPKITVRQAGLRPVGLLPEVHCSYLST